MSAAEKALALLNGLRDAVANLPVRGADPRLAKAFLRVSDCIFELEQWCMESTALEDRALIAACAPYLKDGETPAECIARNRADIDSVLTLLAQAKQSVQHLATCATNGHVYGHAGACIFCGEPKSTPVEPAGASEPPCPHCKLPRVLPEECTPALGAVIDAQIAERWDVLNHGIDLGQQFAAEKAGASEPPRRFVDPEPECPGADCSRCSGEYCDVHITDPCDCDTAERHASDIGKPAPVSPVEPEPCVWRDDHGITRTTCGMTLPEGADDHTYCGYCGAPLKVER